MTLKDQNHCWCYIFIVFVVFFSAHRFAIKFGLQGLYNLSLIVCNLHLQKIVVKITVIYLFSLDLYIGQNYLDKKKKLVQLVQLPELS